MVAAGGKEDGAFAVALHDLQSEHAGVKAQRPGQIRDFQMNVADADIWIGDKSRVGSSHKRASGKDARSGNTASLARFDHNPELIPTIQISSALPRFQNSE